MDFFAQNDVVLGLKQIRELLATGIFSPEMVRSPFVRSAFIDIMICLSDLLVKCNLYATPVNFTDDVIVDDEVSDIHSLVKFVRDAACHFHTRHRKHGKSVFAFNVCYGLVRGGMVGSGCDYADDVAFNFGSQRIYLQRHIVRATDEAAVRLLPLVDSHRRSALEA